MGARAGDGSPVLPGRPQGHRQTHGLTARPRGAAVLGQGQGPAEERDGAGRACGLQQNHTLGNSEPQALGASRSRWKQLPDSASLYMCPAAEKELVSTIRAARDRGDASAGHQHFTGTNPHLHVRQAATQRSWACVQAGPSSGHETKEGPRALARCGFPAPRPTPHTHTLSKERSSASRRGKWRLCTAAFARAPAFPAAFCHQLQSCDNLTRGSFPRTNLGPGSRVSQGQPGPSSDARRQQHAVVAPGRSPHPEDAARTSLSSRKGPLQQVASGCAPVSCRGAEGEAPRGVLPGPRSRSSFQSEYQEQTGAALVLVLGRAQT